MDRHKAYAQGEGGVRRLIEEVSWRAARAEEGRRGSIRFVMQMGEDYAYICPRDLPTPVRFLRQMAGAPPVQLGPDGFRADLVDDPNPARHYTAFLFVGFWLPYVVAWLMLYLWEVAGFVRYRGHWSAPDLRCGLVGIRHGRLVRRHGPSVLPALIAADLTA